MAYFNNAHYTIKAFSSSLRRITSFELIIPNVAVANPVRILKTMKTVFLLHGYTGCAENYVDETLFSDYNFAVVMPSAENSFYTDGKATGRQYATYIARELVQYLRNTFGLARSPEDTYIMGMSMGGFGALSLGMKYPDTFGKIGAMSSALILDTIENMTPDNGVPSDSAPAGDPNLVINYEYFNLCFPHLSSFRTSEDNPEVLAKKCVEQGTTVPPIYMCCGTEDTLLEENRSFERYLTSVGYPHEYHESAGAHDMYYWRPAACNIVRWMLGK